LLLHTGSSHGFRYKTQCAGPAVWQALRIYTREKALSVPEQASFPQNRERTGSWLKPHRSNDPGSHERPLCYRTALAADGGGENEADLRLGAAESMTVSTITLDGSRLAARRAAGIAAGAAAVLLRRGRAPRLLLLAVADKRGRVPHVAAKLRACAAAGIEVVPLMIDAGTTTPGAQRALTAAIAEWRPDAVFVQLPLPAGINEEAITSAIPADSDVDIMSPERVQRYMATPGELPALTISAALLLLEAHAVSIRGRRGALVAEESAFSLMFREALSRSGAQMEPLVAPASADVAAQVSRAELVVVAAGQPGLLHTGMLTRGAVALDIGYFNEGGRGDIDVAPGIEHLAAIMPVPGGVGPMTVSALLERVVQFSSG
jgi:methylenetetrahydrofolate dehydrogenase (NADP+) / methenyltetrahydrofolate cyclohydrolase